MELEITKYTHVDILTRNSYTRYNIMLNGYYVTAFIYNRNIDLYELFEKTYKFIVENSCAVTTALNQKLFLPPYIGSDCRTILKTTINEINLELDRKKQIIRKKLEEIEGDFV